MIAKRTILFSSKDDEEKRSLMIRIFAPIKIIEDRYGSYLHSGSYECKVEYSQIIEGYECYGQNEIQAVYFASNVDPVLKGLSYEYDFFYPETETPLLIDDSYQAG